MARNRPSSKRVGAQTASAGGAEAAAHGGDVRRRPLWLRIVALLVLAGLIVTLVLVNRKEPRPKTAIALEADESTPEMAALLREIDELANSLVEQFPESPEAWEVMARAHYRLGKSQDAEKYWQQCIDMKSDFCPAIHSIGLLNLETGNHAKAVEYFRRALELEPESPAFSVELAQALMADGQAAEAAKVLEEDVKLHPKGLATLAMLGQAYLQNRNYAKAKQYFKRAIVVGPNYSNAYNGLVLACTNLGEEEEAQGYAETLKKIKKSEEKMHSGMLKEHNDSRKIKGVLGEIYFAAANVYLAHNEPGIAEEYLLKAIQNAPKFVAPHEILTWLYQHQGRKEDAVKILRKLIAVAPDDVSAQMDCAELCAEMGWFDEAESAYRKGIELAPEQAGGYAALAWLFIDHVQKLPEAKQLAEEAVRREPLAKHYYLLGVACQINDDKPGARAAIAKAAALDPRNPEYQNVLRMLRERQTK